MGRKRGGRKGTDRKVAQMSLALSKALNIGEENSNTTISSVSSSSSSTNMAKDDDDIPKIKEELRVGISDLKRAVYKSMSTKTLYGKYLLCRTVTAGAKQGESVDAVIEDPEGKLEAEINLSLFNFSTETGVSSVEGQCMKIFPAGTVLLIKNPEINKIEDDGLFQAPGLNSWWFKVKVRDPQNVMIISPKGLQKFFQSVKWRGGESPDFVQVLQLTNTFWNYFNPDKEYHYQIMRNFGNKAVIEQRFKDAVRWYEMAMEDYGQDCQEDTELLVEMAGALLELSRHKEALALVEKVLAVEPLNFRGIHHKAKALIGLRFYEEVKFFLDDAAAKDEGLRNNKELENLQQLATSSQSLTNATINFFLNKNLTNAD